MRVSLKEPNPKPLEGNGIGPDKGEILTPLKSTAPMTSDLDWEVLAGRSDFHLGMFWISLERGENSTEALRRFHAVESERVWLRESRGKQS
jgi:hypothetical protein